MQYSLKRVCRTIQRFYTISLAIFIIYVCLTSVWIQWNQSVLAPVSAKTTREACSSTMYATREGCVPCPRGTFSFPGWSECIPWLNCSEISLQVHARKRLTGGRAKHTWLANWKGYEVVFVNCTRHPPKWRYRYCVLGMTNMEQMQGKFVTRLIGKCNKKLQMVTMYYKHGSAKYLDQLLRRPQFSKYNNIQTRFQLSVDFVRILNFLHNSPIGVRIMCDGARPKKYLSQFLITDDFRLIVNDVDRIPEVTKDQGCDRRPNVSTAKQKIIERQGWQNKSEPLKFRLAPTYDEKIDIWKIPWIVVRLLDGVEGSRFAKNQLRGIMAKCHAINPRHRPTANEVVQELLRVQQLIATNSSHIYESFHELLPA